MATMRTQHAGLVRMPFGEISGDRLQNLNSMKNRQNALQLPSTSKRKATEPIDIFCDSEETFDSENIDPTALFKNKTNTYSQTNKRSKTSSFTETAQFETIVKPTLSTSLAQDSTTSNSLSTTTKLQQRKIAKPRSRIQKSKTTTVFNDSNSTTDKMLQTRLSHPAGRSPTTGRPRVSSMLSGRSRPAAPAFGLARVRDFNRVGLVKSASLNSALGAAAAQPDAMPFDLLAALHGTVPSGHSSRSTSITGSVQSDDGSNKVQAHLPKSTSAPALLSPTVPKKRPAAWDFVIHEDTEDQERENIVSHYTEQLGVSDDEDSLNNNDGFASDKENMPPPNYEPPTTPRRSQVHNLLLSLGMAHDSICDVNYKNAHENYQNEENYANALDMATTPGKLALTPTGEPAEDWARPVAGGLPRSPGMMNLAQLSSPPPKKRRALGELPLEEFVPADVKAEEAEEEEAKTEEKGEGWLKRDSAQLSPIEEDGGADEEILEDDEENLENSLGILEACENQMDFREEVQAPVWPPRTSSLPKADSI